MPHRQQAYDDDYEEILEDQKQERELLFQFSSEERAAWGHLPEKQSMQQILEQVERARAKEQEKKKEESSTDMMMTKDEAATAQQQNEKEEDMGHHESFSHVSQDGTSIHMVDVGHKSVTTRTARAQTKVILPPSVLEAFGMDQQQQQQHNRHQQQELVGPKGPIFATAKIAGIMAAKNTSNLIPLCHPLPLDQVQIDIQLEQQIGTDKNSSSPTGVVTIECTCRVHHKTGVEMEALTGATVAALTIYDMTKAVSHEICITDTKLISKTGGKRKVG
mmetsp:Transcript_3749/g.6895  ORF Transcript_3749/g.6895 Transcript_3749/m.6895 type:complete len:276 (-) Transcript_3749:1280-2107(-)